MKEEIAHTALANLQKAIGFPITTSWKAQNKMETDGKLELQMANKKILLQTIIMKEVGDDQLSQIYKLAYRFSSFIVIAQKISPKVKEIFRQIQLAYLEGGGDIYLYQKNVFLFIDRTLEALHTIPASIPEIKSSGHLILKENF